MKKILLMTFSLLFVISVIGCTETTSTDESGNKTRQFTVGQIATVNKTDIKINSVKKILKDCMFEYDGECQRYTEPENAYFLLIDLTINNNGDEDLSISSLMSFELKDIDGEKGKYAFLTSSLKSQLDGTIMPNDVLKGQIAYDVNNSDSYTFYYRDSLIDSPIKFIINSNDIIE